jgi:hypothetical protein
MTARFIHNDQRLGVRVLDLFEEGGPLPLDVFALLLHGVKRVFSG